MKILTDSQLAQIEADHQAEMNELVILRRLDLALMALYKYSPEAKSSDIAAMTNNFVEWRETYIEHHGARNIVRDARQGNLPSLADVLQKMSGPSWEVSQEIRALIAKAFIVEVTSIR